MLSTISPVSIYGIEGRADTGKEGCIAGKVSGPSGDCFVPPGLIVTGLNYTLHNFSLFI